ncbi:hypothetical protein HYH03_016167 [Edaphochlamys debaryana]|uniref:Chloride conductance regulatory protein ICln n=1 Tax=Edaphochlamys debaryana TaxID=47281 RepID=A0A835XKI0_9CHLO|nr:hypothetical protein HYH03_016167 [Edaphochlamys debaryana]|eukprot:KAG2485070.1 hypothetical protein HYH03_016167 [Edaphochlamys debaryana]
MAARLLTAARRLDIDTQPELNESREPVLDADDEEELRSKCADVELVMGDDLSGGPGVLHLTTRRVVWVSSSPGGPCLALRYPQIVMHAISSDPSAYARPCLYLQLDEGDGDVIMGGMAGGGAAAGANGDAGAGGEDEEEEGEGEEEEGSAEVRLVPTDATQVGDLFKVLCDCAALNPDSEVEGEGDFFFDEAEVMAGLDPSTRAAVIAERLEGGMDLGEGEDGGEDLQELMGDDPGRFEDEDDEEGGEGEEEEGEEGAGQAS